MTTPFPKGFSRSASKRTRSQDSQRSITPAPVLKVSKKEETYDITSIPAFLRQSKTEIDSKFDDLEWKQQLRIAQGRNDPNSKWVQDMTIQVKLRNRYQNVQPWEKSRIRLKVQEGKSDYINASPIFLRDPRSGVETNYIATQGPKKSGLSHFWQMVWQETKEVAVIVMLTKLAEGGREKCFQYFPLDADAGELEIEPNEPDEPTDDQSKTLKGTVKFLEVTTDEISRTTIRKLLLSFGEESRVVWHLLFEGWPDFGVPESEDRAGLLELLKLSSEKTHDSRNPRIIHCSAGVGRSGTFIALEYLLAQLESGVIAEVKDDEDMIYDVVNQLRKQRMTMVQSDLQYRFLHLVLREQFDKYQQSTKISAGSGEPSPKLRKLAKGIKSAIIGGEDRERGDAEADQGKAPSHHE